jgi:hypothetical protein
MGLTGGPAGRERKGIQTQVIGRVCFNKPRVRSLLHGRCIFRKKPHHIGDNVIMPESFPTQGSASAELAGCALDLPREDLDEVFNVDVSKWTPFHQFVLHSCIRCWCRFLLKLSYMIAILWRITAWKNLSLFLKPSSTV